MNPEPPILAPPAPTANRRGVVTLKLLLVGALVLLLHIPLGLINDLRQERAHNREEANARIAARSDPRGGPAYDPAVAAAEGYRMVERALKHSVLVLTLVFTAFFLFETLAGMRLHAVHYALVGAALCLFYLALLALGEVLPPGAAYIGAAAASSSLIVGYSISILHSYGRAGLIAALLAGEHGVLYVVLRMEDYALLTGTAALFVALALVMFCTRRINWHSLEMNAATAGADR